MIRQLLFSSGDAPVTLLMTPGGEAALFFEKDDTKRTQEHFPGMVSGGQLSKLSASGVCMNFVGAKIYKKLSEHGICTLCVSMCDIAVSFIIYSIYSKDSEREVSVIRNNFTPEV